MRAPCPRAACTNTLQPGRVICGPDFTKLAGMCRGKKALGQPTADMIEAAGGGLAYSCKLCRMYHNGGPTAGLAQLYAEIDDILAVLEAHPRVGRRGLLQLAERWRPPFTHRSRWPEHLDQSLAYVSP